jgi:hypothetical protein
MAHLNTACTSSSPVEILEPRLMLSASVVDGVLVIAGTRRGDAIVVTRDGRRAVRVDINGEVASFSFRTFRQIRIAAGLGDDLVTVGTTARVVSVPASISGGDGHDRIVGGAGNDTLDGEGGNDLMTGFDGDDRVTGGRGDDGLFGGAGRDLLTGDGGNDRVAGGADDDSVLSGRGDDELHDGAGKDTVFGNAGMDAMFVTDARKEFRDADGERMDRDVDDVDLVAQPATSDTLANAHGGVVVRYTLQGDAALDGGVNFGDLVELAENYNAYSSTGGGAWWSTGDFDYDGNVNFEDLLVLAKHYNTPAQPTTTDASFAADLAAAFKAVG